jgi:hypothetical protein
MSCYSSSFQFYAGECKTLNIQVNKLNSATKCKEPFGLIPMVRASLVLQDLTFSAKAVGAEGNGITVSYIAGGTAGAEVVTVSGTVIQVQIQAGVSTAAQVKTAVEAFSAANALVTVSITGSGSNAQVVGSGTLSGGTGDKIEIKLPATPSDLVIGYNSNPAVQIENQHLGKIKVDLKAAQTDVMIDGPIVVEITSSTGCKTIAVVSGGVKKLQAELC